MIKDFGGAIPLNTRGKYKHEYNNTLTERPAAENWESGMHKRLMLAAGILSVLAIWIPENVRGGPQEIWHWVEEGEFS